VSVLAVTDERLGENEVELAERSDRLVAAHFNAPFTFAIQGGMGSIGRSSLPTSRHAAELLAGMGLSPGEAIAVWLEPGGARFRLLLGAAQAGIPAVPIDPAEPLLNVRRMLRAWRVRLLIVPEASGRYDYVAAARLLREVHTELRWITVSDFDAA
jgi:non-ribosomal peptide synthetase component F